MSELNQSEKKQEEKTYLQKLKEKEATIKARIQLIENREKEQKRKSETRLKILLGAFMLDEIKKQTAEESNLLKEKVMQYFTKERDSNLIKCFFDDLNK